jgi:hypothetical protein
VHLNFTMIFSKKSILFSKNKFKRINYCKFIHHKSHLQPFLSYLSCIVRSIIFNVKKCALYLIKYRRCFGIFGMGVCFAIFGMGVCFGYFFQKGQFLVTLIVFVYKKQSYLKLFEMFKWEKR